MEEKSCVECRSYVGEDEDDPPECYSCVEEGFSNWKPKPPHIEIANPSKPWSPYEPDCSCGNNPKESGDAVPPCCIGCEFVTKYADVYPCSTCYGGGNFTPEIHRNKRPDVLEPCDLCDSGQAAVMLTLDKERACKECARGIVEGSGI